MRTVIMYECEQCARRYEKQEDAQKCEANHYFLTYDEYLRWKELNQIAAKAGRTVAYQKNSYTDKEFEEACQELAKFESDHDLAVVQKPKDFLLLKTNRKKEDGQLRYF